MPLSQLGQFLFHISRILGYLKDNTSALLTVCAGIFKMILTAMLVAHNVSSALRECISLERAPVAKTRARQSLSEWVP